MKAGTNPHMLYLPFNREGGFVLETLAATCDITPLELEMLLILWILIYCCFILHHLIFWLCLLSSNPVKICLSGPQNRDTWDGVKSLSVLLMFPQGRISWVILPFDASRNNSLCLLWFQMTVFTFLTTLPPINRLVYLVISLNVSQLVLYSL